jgi:hypothetical protein
MSLMKAATALPNEIDWSTCCYPVGVKCQGQNNQPWLALDAQALALLHRALDAPYMLDHPSLAELHGWVAVALAWLAKTEGA